MKQIQFAIIFLLAGSLTAMAQNTASSFMVDGIKVIYKPTNKQIINISVYFRGGVTDYAAAQAGIENLAAGGAAQCGTKQYSKDDFKDEQDEYGMSIFGSAGRDNASIGLYCISKYFDKGWALLAQAVTNPIFDQGEFDKLKQRTISSIKQAASNPDSKLDDMIMTNAFAGTPYAVNPTGTDTTVQSITAAQAKDFYYNTLLNKSRMFIVVVGNLSKADITAKIHAAFAAIPSSPYHQPSLNVPQFTGTALNVEERQLATNYIAGVMNFPLYTSPDFIAARLAFATLYDTLFTEVRTKRNLSYAPGAMARVGLMPYSELYVSTTDPNAAVTVMVNVVNQLKQNGFSERNLQDSKALFITSNYMRQESTNAMAASLGTAEILGNWKIAEEMPGLINKTTVDDINHAFRKYITGVKWNYLGGKKLADDASAAFGTPIVQ